MRQLNATDSQLLQVESVNAPEHIATLTVYDQSTAPKGNVKFKDILRVFESSIGDVAFLTQKIARVPFNLDNPFWTPDPHFDLEYHVRHIALPQPGDWRQLCIQVARLHAQGLDMSKPLWQAYVIEGLDNVAGIPENSFAIYWKMHHSAVDGMALNEAFTSLHSLKPKAPKGKYGSDIAKWERPAEPKPMELLAATLPHMFNRPIALTKEVTGILPEVFKGQRFKRDNEYKPAHTKPSTRFDTPVSRNRVFNGIQLPLDDIQAIRKEVDGATVNDVAVAIVSGALRLYLAKMKELPKKSLIGWIPVNIRPKGKGAEGGNLFSTLTTSIHTDVANPMKRLQSIAKTTRTAKRYREEVGDDLFMRLTDHLPPIMQGMLGNITTLSAKMGASALPANVSISNVPGPPQPIYLAGAKAVLFQGIGLIQDGHGLFHVVSSYCDDLLIGFLGCREQMPDPQYYKECLENSFKELLSIVPEK